MAATRSLESSLEYSFALEYRGPPIPFDLPQALPIELDRIPLASLASSPTSLVPVAVPLLSPKPQPSAVSPTSVVDGLGPSGELPPGPSDDLSEDADHLSRDFTEIVDFSIPRGSHLSTESSELDCHFDEESLPPPARSTVSVKFKDELGVDGAGAKVGRVPHASFLASGTQGRPRKGTCYGCFKGNRFTEKEACLVCDAKYCVKCVLRKMGSMPEGRKCVTCIGSPVVESRREGLGKCSRMLRRLLSPQEIEQVMRSERYCEANQLQSECVCVNGRPLLPEEMVALRSCKIPPTKLKPGSYWYDKVSGLWGKEGCKPHLIISPNLNISSPLLPDASKGNTGVFINGRNITKSELKMLKHAGVQCAGNPHFWVDSDGTYQEEGMKNVKGNLWGKPHMRVVCYLLSLPHPHSFSKAFSEVDNAVNRAPEYTEKRSLQKLLLFGCHGSGTGTILKQAKLLYNPVPFSEEDREIIKVRIQTSIYYYLCILLEGRERFEEECLADQRNSSPEGERNLENETDYCTNKTIYSISSRLKAFSDWLLNVLASGNLEAIFPAATREYAPLVEELWKDPAIQATYARQYELQNLPTSASYFLERAVDISRMEYEPSDKDILYAHGVSSSNGLEHTEFIFPNSAHDCGDLDDARQYETVFRYQLIAVQSKGPFENMKWLDMFEDARLVIFCVALSDYNEYYEDPTGETVNKMLCSKLLLESLITHPTFEEMEFLLVLTKFDLLEMKLEATPLTECSWFDDYNPVRSHQKKGNNSRRASNSATPAEQAFHYIAVKFKKLYSCITGRKLYVTMANGLDSESVDRALRYGREVLKWEDERAIFGTNEISTYSTDPSSLSD